MLSKLFGIFLFKKHAPLYKNLTQIGFSKQIQLNKTFFIFINTRITRAFFNLNVTAIFFGVIIQLLQDFQVVRNIIIKFSGKLILSFLKAKEKYLARDQLTVLLKPWSFLVFRPFRRLRKGERYQINSKRPNLIQFLNSKNSTDWIVFIL